MKYILFSIAFISAITTSGQKPKIAGIGKFQIGKTTISIISDLSKEYNVPIRETNDDLATIDEFNYNGLSKIFYISKEANEAKLQTHSRYSEHPNVKVYYLNNVIIADLTFHDVWLKFYKDTLYSIKTDTDKYIDSALALKYGSGKLTKTSKTIHCSNAYRDFKYTEWSFYRAWPTANNTIVATSTNSKYYNSNCEGSTLHYLTIYNIKKDLLINTQLHRMNKDAKKENDIERAKTLSGL